MKILILETATDAPFIAFVDGSCSKHINLKPGPFLSTHLAPLVKELLGNTIPDLIGVGQGPGSFTGIRVGTAFAEAFAFGLQIPIVGFCSLEPFFPEEDGPFTTLLDARSGGAYILEGVKKGPFTSFADPKKIPLNQLPSLQGLLISPRPEVFSFQVAKAEPNYIFTAHSAQEKFLREGGQGLKLSYLSVIP